jgi:hypothetical protein
VTETGNLSYPPDFRRPRLKGLRRGLQKGELLTITFSFGNRRQASPRRQWLVCELVEFELRALR